MGTKKFLMQDPLQLASPVLGRLSKLEEGNAFKIEDGYTFTADGEYLLMVVKPTNPPSETVENNAVPRSGAKFYPLFLYSAARS